MLDSCSFPSSILHEREVAPERALLLGRRGWYVQQLIKIAMADVVETPFYLTLDCDLMCVRRCQESDVIIDGKAVLDLVEPPHDHPDWYVRAAAVLRLPPPAHEMSVTPVMYSAAVMKGLHDYVRAS